MTSERIALCLCGHMCESGRDRVPSQKGLSVVLSFGPETQCTTNRGRNKDFWKYCNMLIRSNAQKFIKGAVSQEGPNRWPKRLSLEEGPYRILKEIITLESIALGLCAKMSEKCPHRKKGLIVDFDFGPRIHNPTTYSLLQRKYHRTL